MPTIGNININNMINKANNQSDKNKMENLKSRINNAKEDKSLLKASQEFEALFIQMMLKEMRSTIPEGGLVEKSKGREIFQDMYDQEISKSISQGGNQGIGLAKLIYEQMKSNKGVL